MRDEHDNLAWYEAQKRVGEGVRDASKAAMRIEKRGAGVDANDAEHPAIVRPAAAARRPFARAVAGALEGERDGA